MHEPQYRRERETELYFISTSAKNVVSMWDSRKPRPMYRRHVSKYEGKENPLRSAYDGNCFHSHLCTSQRVNNCQAGIVHLVHCPLNYSYSEGLKMTH